MTLAESVIPARAPATAQVIRDADEWDDLRTQWDTLFDASPTASPPLRFEWLRLWWRIYGPVYGRELCIITIRRGGQLLGALPLYVAGAGAMRRLAFLSSGEAESEETCAEYLDLLHLPGCAEVCLDAIAATLQTMRWDTLELSNVSELSPLAGWVRSWTGRGKAHVESRGVCPIAELDGDMEAYLQALSAAHRQRFRRLMRLTRRAEARFELARDTAQAQRFFHDLCTLHQQRWAALGQPGCFAAKRFRDFHRALSANWVPRGQAVLARLSSRDDTPLAVIYGFVVADKFDFYQSGIAPHKTDIDSPGIAANLLLMQRLSERHNVRRYDFLRGQTDYKRRLSTTRRELLRLSVVRPGVRVAACAALSLTSRAWRRVRKLAQRIP